MMNIDTAKRVLIEANNAYRVGRPFMDDIAYDNLVEEFEQNFPEEYKAFRESLHEKEGKVQHPWVLGSLEKIKAEDTDNLAKFIRSLSGETTLIASRKVDGISCRIHYSDGKYISASTRGDGYYGEDITDKVRVIVNRYGLSEINEKGEIDIRGELVIEDANYSELNKIRIAKGEKEFNAKRNAVAGLFGQKTWSADEIKYVSFVAYTILGSENGKQVDLWTLHSLGFQVTFWKVIPMAECADSLKLSEKLNSIIADFDATCTYEGDGLVLCGANFKGEDTVYLPKGMMAYKLNRQVTEAKIIDVDWSRVSKDGTLCPVAVLEPVVLGGVTVQRVSLHNLDFIDQLGIKVNCIVRLIRSGDVIPYIEEVVGELENSYNVRIPEVCPSCGKPVTVDGPFVRCENPDCPEKAVQVAKMFLEKLDVKGFKADMLRNWGIKNIEDMINFVPDANYKSQVSFREAIVKAMSKSERELFLALNFKGLSTILLSTIIDFYGFNEIKTTPIEVLVAQKGYPANIGQARIDQFASCLEENLKTLKMLVDSAIFTGVRSENEVVAPKVEMDVKGSICVTGSLKFGSRGKFEEFAKQHGYEAKSGVAKGLTYLITNDPNSGSSKNKRAKELGIKVITEDEFMAIIGE